MSVEEILYKGKWLLSLSQTSPGFYVSALQSFRKHSGKRRNCSQRAIPPFPTVFSTNLENILPFSSTQNCPLQILFSVWKSLKFVVWERINKQFLLLRFSNSLFCSFGEPYAIFIKSTIICRLQTLEMWNSLKFVVWERVKLG